MIEPTPISRIQTLNERFKYETGLKRFGAAIVDGIVLLPLLFVQNFFFDDNNSITVYVSWTILYTILTCLYSIILHYKYGQTIGKWVTGVKVVDISETRNLTLTQAFMRDSVYIFGEAIALVYFGLLIYQDSVDKTVYEDYRSATDLFALCWVIVELVTMLTNKKRRALHDYIARSVVIRVSK